MDLNLYRYINQDLLPKLRQRMRPAMTWVAAELNTIEPWEIVLVPTNKAYMQVGRSWHLYFWSLVQPRKATGLDQLAIGVIIDGDYYGNPGNEGHILLRWKHYDQEVVPEAMDVWFK